MTAMVPSKPPEHEFRLGPSPSSFLSTSDNNDYQSPSKVPVDFSPPLIAMVVVVATAFLIVTYSRLISRHLLPPFLRLLRSWRRWHRRRRRRRSHMPSSAGDIESPPYNGSFDATEAYQVFSPYGLDESVIKTIPLSLYTAKGLSKHGFVDDSRDCAVCLLEFEDNDCVRVLPVCSHAFHVDCIDIWLRSHANCPLCRAGIFRHESPFIPVMAARIRPSLDDAILESILLEPLSEAAPESETTVTEIVPAEPSPRRNQSEDRFNARDFMLKRSYSFGFERNFPSERLVMGAGDGVPVEIPKRKLLEQAAISVWVIDEVQSLLFSILPRHEVPILPPERQLLPVIRIPRPLLRRRLLPAHEIINQPNIHTIVRHSLRLNPTKVSRSRSTPIPGAIQPKVENPPTCHQQQHNTWDRRQRRWSAKDEWGERERRGPLRFNEMVWQFAEVINGGW
ncbi:RING-H2 finger protein ATL65 [Vitis vinifera]|uniref:RING-type E3 ubiquitin transferase n=1 Tax=Vitis vinifera TaxID=29760 RepID=A0A438JTI1_VITVI|nr:RING-H2 finger protein ATL65 [Vitis vinifera]